MLFLVTFACLLRFSFATHDLTLDRLQERDSSNCSAVHFFLARGNTESYPGRVGALADYGCSGLPSCDSENIQFDSTLVYCDQVADGVTNGVSQITDYAARCPNAKLVLGGYSLGAQIVGDILGGGSGSFYTCTEPTVGGLSIDSTPGSHISAVAMFGNVRHVAGESYNVGPGSADNGQYPRSGTQLSDLNQFSAITHDYCLSTDPICALGDDGLSHTTYMEVYGAAAGAWIQELLDFVPAATLTSAAAVATSTYTTTSSASSAAAASSSTTTTASGSVESGALASNGTSTASTTDTEHGTTISSSIKKTTSSSTSSASSTTTYVPFVFSQTGDVAATATTSTFTASTATFSASTIARSSSSTSAFITTGSNSTATAASTSTSSTSLVTIASKGGAFSNNAPYTMSLVTLVILKVLTS